jgi:hypothetical protein
MENQQYLQKSNLQDVRNELGSIRQNDSQNIKQESDALLRAIENLDQAVTEQMLNLKSEISLEMSNHKSDTKELAKAMDLCIQNVQHKLVIRLAEMKTNIETLKVELTTNIVWMTVLTMGAILTLDWILKKESGEKKEPLQESDV